MENQNIVRYARSKGRRRVLDVDLNIPPPLENQDDDGILNNDVQEGQTGEPTQQPPIDLEAIDDDVMIVSSPRAFEEASRNSRRSRRRPAPVVVDVESGPSRIRRRRTVPVQTIINCETYINLEGESSSTVKTVSSTAVPPIPPPVPQELIFNCPVCMLQLVEEMSTKCGHIFCKACIKKAISIQQKCPTCRKKTTARDIFRIYLPSTQSS